MRRAVLLALGALALSACRDRSKDRAFACSCTWLTDTDLEEKQPVVDCAASPAWRAGMGAHGASAAARRPMKKRVWICMRAG